MVEVNIDLTETEIERVTKALEFYYHYTVAQNRGDGSYLDLAERLKKKQPQRETAGPERQKKRG